MGPRRGYRCAEVVCTTIRRITGRRLIAAFAVSAVLAGCTPPQSRETPTIIQGAERTDRKEGDKEAKVGQTLQVHELDVTVTEVGRRDAYSPNENAGYIWAKVKYENKRGGETKYSRLDWQLERPDKTSTSRVPIAGEEQLVGGDILPGGTAEGLLIFEARDLEGQFALVYAPRHHRLDDPTTLQRGVWIFDSKPEGQ